MRSSTPWSTVKLSNKPFCKETVVISNSPQWTSDCTLTKVTNIMKQLAGILKIGRICESRFLQEEKWMIKRLKRQSVCSTLSFRCLLSVWWPGLFLSMGTPFRRENESLNIWMQLITEKKSLHVFCADFCIVTEEFLIQNGVPGPGGNSSVWGLGFLQVYKYIWLEFKCIL